MIDNKRSWDGDFYTSGLSQGLAEEGERGKQNETGKKATQGFWWKLASAYSQREPELKHRVGPTLRQGLACCSPLSLAYCELPWGQSVIFQTRQFSVSREQLWALSNLRAAGEWALKTDKKTKTNKTTTTKNIKMWISLSFCSVTKYLVA